MNAAIKHMYRKDEKEQAKIDICKFIDENWERMFRDEYFFSKTLVNLELN